MMSLFLLPPPPNSFLPYPSPLLYWGGGGFCRFFSIPDARGWVWVVSKFASFCPSGGRKEFVDFATDRNERLLFKQGYTTFRFVWFVLEF